MNWIDVPAHRLLRITQQELKDYFDCLDENSNIATAPLSGGVGPVIHLIKRRIDGKLFRFSKFQYLDPASGFFLLKEI